MHISDEEQEWSEHSSDDDDVSSEQEELPVSGKLKRKPENKGGAVMKKVKYEDITEEKSSKKNTKNELYKAPTVEELNELKETQNLYNNNLFRLQIEELVKEVKIKNKHINSFTTWYKTFEEFIKKLPEYKVNSSKVKDAKRKQFTECDQEYSLEFEKPESVDIFGLYKINALPGPFLHVNINVSMPRSCFNVKDYLNNRYFVKRYYYLTYIEHFLKRNKIAKNIEWVLHEGNDFLPILQFSPEGNEKIIIKLFASPTENYFKPQRFLPDVNNIKLNVLEASNIDADLLKELPTPFYNSALAHDVTLKTNHKFIEKQLSELNNVQEAVKLIQVWLGQRHINEGFGSFTENLVLYFIVYLITKKKINKHMSSYQVVRNFWSFIKDSDLTKQPISLCDDVKNEDFDKFKASYDVVFLDTTGCYNVAAFLSVGVYEKIKHECNIAFNLLDEGGINSFHWLFISKLPTHLQYDLVLSLKSNSSYKKLINTSSKEDRIKFFGYDKLLVTQRLSKLLQRGLNKRALVIVPIHQEKSNSLSSPTSTELSFGILLDPSHAFSFLEMGPALNDPKEKEFREFWGSLSSDRRFKDGSICVAVYFETSTIQGKRDIITKILDWIVSHKLSLKYKLYFNNFEDLIVNKNISCSFALGTNEECCLKVIAASDELGKKLRALEMPLSVTGVQGVSDIFSFTEVFPPIPTNYKVGKLITATFENNIILNNKIKAAPRYVHPIECVLHLEHSSKWPKDVEGIRKMTLAFYLQMSKLLEKKHGIVTSVKPTFIDVFYEGFVFRYTLYVPRVVGLLKKETTENGVTVYKDSHESKELEKNLVILPKLTSALKGIQSQHPSYGTSTALIKRWLRSHLIDNYHFPDVVINLLNASLYLSKTAFSISTTPQIGFLRFLKFISELQCNIQPVVVNFNEEISKESLAQIDSKLLQNRESCPNLYLAIPYDNCESLLTKTAPSKEVLRRVKQLANETLSCFDSIVNKAEFINVEELFVPNLDGYNVLIHLKPLLNPLRHEQVNRGESGGCIKLEAYDASESTKVPVIGFNPIQFYLNNLRENYSEYASFFYDSYGGNVIGVLWTPKALEEREFKVTQVNGRKFSNGKLITNVDGIIEDFYILGKDLVKSIDKK